MRAAVLHRPGLMTIDDVITPKCDEGGILIRMEACSICTTDVKMHRQGHRDLCYPRIPGHEMTGVVIEDRSFDGDIQVGMRVQIAPGIPCGVCKQCQRGADNQCPEVGIFGFNRDGGMAEFLSVPEASVEARGVTQIPTGIDFEQAALAEPLACCINAQELVRVGSGDSVLIIGGGPTGLLHAQLARSKQVDGIILSEPEEERRILAKHAGIDHLVDPIEQDLSEFVNEVTDEEGMDVVILASRDIQINDRFLELLSPRGRLSLFSGIPDNMNRPGLDLNRVHYRELMLTGAYGCTVEQNRCALDLLQRGVVSVDWMITCRTNLDDVEEAMAHTASRKGLKAMVRMV